jgi:hypothetical protein
VPVDVSSGPPLDERGRRAVAETWRYRARAEREAQARFERLSRQLAEVGAGEAVLGLARKAAQDERRHARLCAHVAARYGLPDRDRAPVPAPEVAPVRLSPRERVLYEIVAFCCVAESLNAALLTVIVERATVPLIREASRRILRDEVHHARLGWAHLSSEAGQGRAGFLPRWLPAMLDAAIEDSLLRPSPADPAEEALAAHGNLSRATRLELVQAALRDVLCPGLESMGVDAGPGRAWLERALTAHPEGVVSAPGAPPRGPAGAS